MSDLVVVEETGSTVVIQEVAAANIVEVIAAGPQGGQGIQGLKGDKGDKGDTGDVTPAAQAAQAAAEAAAAAASTSQTSAASSASSASTSAATATTQAGIASTAATNAASSATAAAGSASSAAISATAAGNSATSAASSATNAAASAATATTKAADASTAASAASTSATTAAGSATAAAGSAASASTQATAAASSASNAATSATSAAGSATSASTSASNAATSAATATGAADTATTQAGEASTSATSAAASAAAAAASAGAIMSGGIRYDAAQSLSDGQKAQAQGNIGMDGLQSNLGFAGQYRRITGDFGNSLHAARVLVQNSTPNASTLFGLIPSGTGNISRFYAYNGSDPDNAGFAQLAALSTDIRLAAGKQGTGAYLPLTVYVGGSERARWNETTGNFILGSSVDDGVNKLQVSGSIIATQFNGSAAGLTGLKTVNGNSILGSGDITITAGVSSFNTRTGAITLTSGDVTTALGFTPYSAANPSSYISGITGSMVTTALGFTPENVANRNAVNGYAGLDATGKVAAAQLPSYVDDVVEAANLAALPGTGEAGKIYVTLDTNKTYRWSGSAYVEISASPGSTDAVTEGSVNLYFTQARARAAISASGSLSYSNGVVSYTAPTALSAFTNDSDFITSSALSPYLTSASAASAYQPTLVSGTNIKSINGASLLGSGNVTLSVGASSGTTPPASPTADQLWWDSTYGILKIYYNDGNTSQWVDALPSSSGASSSVFSNTYTLTGTTFNGVETEIFISGMANARIPVTINKTVYYLIEIAGRRTDGTTMESVVISQRCAALNNAGTTSDLGSITETILFRSDANFNADARSSDTTDSLNIYVQGATGKTITWKVVVQTVEI